ncbi:MAG TPA: phosphatase PAP2 family protein [Bacteroidales bacterium]|nr:phosphatase PAP2 family protein [Bacteroidales bacterium]
MLRKTLKDNILFFLPYILILLLILPVLLNYNKGDLHLMINRHHTAFFDVLFALLTYLGDGLFIIVPAVILLFFSVRHTAFLVTAYVSTGLITQVLKRVFFEGSMRPSVMLKDAGLYLVEGVDMLHGRSFPSGHATSAFALFLSLALILRNRCLKFLCFIMACLVAFSRVYLSQHFLIDITAGSMIGTLGTLAVYMLFYKKERNWYTWKIQDLFSAKHA